MARRVVLIVVGVAFLGAAAWLMTRPPAAPPTTAIVPAAKVAPAPTPARPTVADPAPEKPRPGTPKPTRKIDTPTAAPVEAAPTTGTLRIVVDVADASVFIDRKFVGTAPVTATDIAPGPHHLNVSAPGYDAVSDDLDVTPGTRELSIRLKDVRLSATLAVTHKHAMGSCAGTLRASPQGITYETTNKSDAFTVTMADIETFEVDYLSKNLKLSLIHI